MRTGEQLAQQRQADDGQRGGGCDGRDLVGDLLVLGQRLVHVERLLRTHHHRGATQPARQRGARLERCATNPSKGARQPIVCVGPPTGRGARGALDHRGSHAMVDSGVVPRAGATRDDSAVARAGRAAAGAAAARVTMEVVASACIFCCGAPVAPAEG